MKINRKTRAEIEILNSPFSEALGWKKNGKLTKAGKMVARNQ